MLHARNQVRPFVYMLDFIMHFYMLDFESVVFKQIQNTWIFQINKLRTINILFFNCLYLSLRVFDFFQIFSNVLDGISLQNNSCAFSILLLFLQQLRQTTKRNILKVTQQLTIPQFLSSRFGEDFLTVNPDVLELIDVNSKNLSSCYENIRVFLKKK